jgi:tetratricopeptide (TPR) repeat protein
LPFLESHPLAALFPNRGHSHLARGRQLRAALIETVDALRPDADTASGSRAARRHQALTERYVNGRDVTQVCALLNVSQSELYRVLKEALDAVVMIFQECLPGSGNDPSSERATTGVPQVVPVIPQTALFTGRQRELGSLQSQFEGLQAGEGGRVLIIEGPAGVGKTRLVSEFLGLVRKQGGRGFLGRWFQEDSAPYSGWLEALTHEVRQLPPAASRSLEEVSPELLALFGLATRRPAVDQGFEARQDQQRRLYDGVVRLLGIVGDKGPFVLALDDLQWAPALDLLSHVARRIRTLNVLIIAAVRDHEMNPHTGLHKDLAQLIESRHASVFRLAPLAKADSDLLVSALLKGTSTEGLREVVFQRSQGNPFFIEELVRALWESGSLVNWASEWDLAEAASLPVPSTITAVLEKRISSLSPDARRVLSTASILGERFDGGLLHALSGLDEDLIVAAIEEALTANLLIDESKDSEETYRFLDLLVRQVLYDEIAGPSRRQLHKKACEAIKQFYGDDLEHHTQELARHYQNASDLRSGAEYAYRSGMRAEAVYAWGSAIKWYEMALALWGETGSSSRQEADAALRLGRVYCQSTLDVGKAILVLNRALDVFKERGERNEVAAVHLELGRAFMVSSAVQQSNLERTLVHLHAARTILEKSPITRQLAEVYQSLHRAHSRLGQVTESALWADKARAAGEELQSPDIVAQALSGIGSRLITQGAMTEGLSKFEEAWNIAIAESLALEADTLRATAALQIGVLLKAPRRGLEWAQRQPTYGTLQDTVSVPSRLISIYTLLGDYESANVLVGELEARLRASDQPRFGQSPSHAGLLLFRTGDWDPARSFLEEGLAWAEARQYFSPAIETITVLGELLVEMGDLAEAEWQLNKGYEMAQRSQSQLNLARIVPRLCEVYLAQGKLLEAGKLLSESSHLPKQFADSSGMVAEFLLAQGLAYVKSGQKVPAESAFEEAARHNASAGLPWDEANVYAKWAATLDRGEEGARRDLLTEKAWLCWQRCGATAYARRWLHRAGLKLPVGGAGQAEPFARLSIPS